MADHGHPDAALGVHGQPVGLALAVQHVHEHAPVGQPLLAGVVEHRDLPRRGVVVVRQRPARGPLQAVGRRRAGEHHVHLAGAAVRPGGEAVQARRARRLRVRHGAGVEAAVRVAAALVHAQPGLGAPQLGQRGQLALGAHQREAALHGEHGAAAGAGTHDGGHVAHVGAFHGTVRAQGQHVPGEHVHPAQAPAGGQAGRGGAPVLGPDGALAVIGDGIGDLLGAHAVLLCSGSTTAGRARRPPHPPRTLPNAQNQPQEFGVHRSASAASRNECMRGSAAT